MIFYYYRLNIEDGTNKFLCTNKEMFPNEVIDISVNFNLVAFSDIIDGVSISNKKDFDNADGINKTVITN